GRFTVFVVADATAAVFENGSESNNTASAPAALDVMPIPYADLRVEGLTVPATALSGNPLAVTWTVRNDGIGRTDFISWTDTVVIARASDGTGVVTSLGFDHIGVLEAGGSYVRTGNVLLPNGLSGVVYVIVKTTGPYEFIFNDAGNTASA